MSKDTSYTTVGATCRVTAETKIYLDVTGDAFASVNFEDPIGSSLGVIFTDPLVLRDFLVNLTMLADRFESAVQAREERLRLQDADPMPLDSAQSSAAFLRELAEGLRQVPGTFLPGGDYNIDVLRAIADNLEGKGGQ